MRRVLEDLGLSQSMELYRPDPCDTIITPQRTFSFWNNHRRTIEELHEFFPHEGEQLRAFFRFLTDAKLEAFVQLRRLTFRELLDRYFGDRLLKDLLALPLVAIGGLPPSKMSACVGAQFYTEFILDGGYIPAGGMQHLSDTLADRFRALGGALLLSRKVDKISVREKTAVGVNIDREGFVPAKFIVSNGDARQTFLALLSTDDMDPEFLMSLRGMQPSLSSFLLYLGMDEGYHPPFLPGTVHYHFAATDPEMAYSSILHDDIRSGRWYAIRSSTDSKALYVEMLTTYQDEEYWRRNKDQIMDSVIAKIEAEAVPGVSRHIRHREAATPATLHRYTLNYQGASYGWAGTPEQTIVPGLRKPSFIKNLYLVGHWTTLAVGISGVAYIGHDTAKTLAKRRKCIFPQISA